MRLARKNDAMFRMHDRLSIYLHSRPFLISRGLLLVVSDRESEVGSIGDLYD